MNFFISFLTLSLGLCSSVAHSEPLKNERFQKFDVKLDSWAEDQIQFWVRVFTEFKTSDAIVHDSMNLKHLYQVVESSNSKKISEAKQAVRSGLLSIYKKNEKRKAVDAESLTESERKLYEALEGTEDPRAYRFAAENDRVRNQLGQKDRLENAYSISKLYLPRMEEMFEEEGVPKELTRLPFVESGFLNEAKSSVGALGIWQFMPRTAEKDLRLDSAIDERYDPLKSTRAAAKYLKQNHKLLHSWALSIMAYHHGAGLVMKAMKRLKTNDPVQIAHYFKSGAFQFASRNYLFEFLAMLDVDAMHGSFFASNLKEKKLPAYITVSFPEKRFIRTMIEHYHLNESEFKLLNPHFKSTLWSNQLPVPSHYPVRMSGISLEEFRKNSL